MTTEQEQNSLSVDEIHSAQQPNVTSTVTKPLLLYLLGDSLTEGYSKYGTIFHSYGINLQNRFEQTGINIVIKENGVSGDFVLAKRMEKRLRKFFEENKKVDWVIIMGGTNDLNGSSNARRIFEGLKELYDICEQHNAKVLAMSILELDTTFFPDYLNRKRIEINEFIKNYATTNENVTFYDLAKDLPYEKNLYWEPDGVHLTTDGYDRMGDLIFETLYKIIKSN